MKNTSKLDQIVSFSKEHLGFRTAKGVICYRACFVIPDSGAVLISRIKFKATHELQGIRITMDDGIMEVNGVRSNGFVLWQDTVPTEVRLKVTKKRGKSEMRLCVNPTWLQGGQPWHPFGNSSFLVAEMDESTLQFFANLPNETLDYDDFQFEVKWSQFTAKQVGVSDSCVARESLDQIVDWSYVHNQLSV